MTVSVDTFRSEVAAKAVETFGPLVVNDISAGELDPAMLSVVADCGVPYIAMHMKGDPKTMQSQTDYRRDIVTEVVGYFRRRTDEMLAAGIRRENIILDPGFGFAKTTEQNYELLAGLHRLCALGYPVLDVYKRQPHGRPLRRTSTRSSRHSRAHSPEPMPASSRSRTPAASRAAATGSPRMWSSKR